MFGWWRRRSGVAWVKRTAMPARKKPLPAGKPLARGHALKRAAIVRTVALARTARPRRRKTQVGEFSAKARRRLYARFNARCAVCGDPMHPESFTVQHRRARGAGGSADPVTVTLPNGLAVHEVPCHRRIEDNPRTALRAGWRVLQGADPATVTVRIWTGERVRLLTDGGWVAADPEES